MRVLFYTAAALAASIANLSHAMRIDFDNSPFIDDFSEVEAFEEFKGMSDAQQDAEIERMDKEVKAMQEANRRDMERNRVETDR